MVELDSKGVFALKQAKKHDLCKALRLQLLVSKVFEVRENKDFTWPTKEKETVSSLCITLPTYKTKGLETTLTCPSSHSWNLGWKDFTALEHN